MKFPFLQTDQSNEFLYHSEDSVPEHVAVIMDGNGWWAQKQGMPRIFGHKRDSFHCKIGQSCSPIQSEDAHTLYIFYRKLETSKVRG